MIYCQKVPPKVVIPPDPVTAPFVVIQTSLTTQAQHRTVIHVIALRTRSFCVVPVLSLCVAFPLTVIVVAAAPRFVSADNEIVPAFNTVPPLYVLAVELRINVPERS